MTQYLLTVHDVEGADAPSDEAMQEAYKAVESLNQQLKDQGAWVFAGGLHPVASATVVRDQGGEILITDGPFTEAKEQVGGFWIIDAPDLDAALDWAKQATVACLAPVEVRPFQDEPQA